MLFNVSFDFFNQITVIVFNKCIKI